MNVARLEQLLDDLHQTDPRLPVVRRLCVVSCGRSDAVGAGISLVDGEHWSVLEATQGPAQELEYTQVRYREGPCMEAVRTRAPSLHEDLERDGSTSDWRNFRSAARQHEVRSVFAFPLVRRGRALGALGVYSLRAEALSADQIDDLTMLADLASLSVERRGTGTGVPGTGLEEASPDPWAHPAVVHQASGMVSAQLHVSVEDALLRLRAFAFASDLPVDRVARDVVERRLRMERWDDDE